MLNNKNSFKVSVIMNCRNGDKFLKKSINSIISQTYENWELIFFDNSSTDKSVEVVKNFSDKRIKIFKSKKFLKLYDARNLAISKAKGDFISFCDTDDWWKKIKLEKQIKVAVKNRSNFVFSNLLIFDNKTKNTKLYFRKKYPNGKITQELLNDYKVGILTVLMRKKLFKKKKFNKKFNIIGDFDFFLRLSLEQEFHCIQEPLAYYRHHENNYSKNTNIYLKEMRQWYNVNKSKFKRLKYSLKRFEFWLYKLKLKNFIKSGL